MISLWLILCSWDKLFLRVFLFVCIYKLGGVGEDVVDFQKEMCSMQKESCTAAEIFQ